MKLIKTTALDISEVARHSGLTASTLRFYEEKGLIHSTGRHGLRRLFYHRVLEQLEFIALGRQAGFTLEEIGTLFTAEGGFQINRNQLLNKANVLDKNIKKLLAVRDGLRHAAQCSAPSHIECPKFQRLLRLAGKNQVRKFSRNLKT